MTELAEERPAREPRGRPVLGIGAAFAGRGALWGALVVVVVSALSAFPGALVLGAVPGVLGGAIAGFATGIGAGLARLAARTTTGRLVAAALGGALGATVPLLGLALWSSLRFEWLYPVAVVAVLAGVLAPFALLRIDGVRRDGSGGPLPVIGVCLAVFSLLLWFVRSDAQRSALPPSWALITSAALALLASAVMIVALVRRNRTAPHPRVSESDGVWGVLALGLIVLAIGAISLLIANGAQP